MCFSCALFVCMEATMWTVAARERYKGGGRRYPSDLTDVEWQTIEPVLCGYATLAADLREMVNASLYFEKAGCCP